MIVFNNNFILLFSLQINGEDYLETTTEKEFINNSFNFVKNKIYKYNKMREYQSQYPGKENAARTFQAGDLHLAIATL